MKSNLVIALGAFLAPLGWTTPLQAQHMNAADAPCKAAGTGVEQVNCLNVAVKKADADLNSVYQRITGILEIADRQKLQSAERAWLLYRDQACAAERDLYSGGTGGLAAYPACLEAVTRHRISDLRTAYWWKVEKFGG